MTDKVVKLQKPEKIRLSKGQRIHNRRVKQQASHPAIFNG